MFLVRIRPWRPHGVLDGVQDPPREKAFGGIGWRNVSYTENVADGPCKNG